MGAIIPEYCQFITSPNVAEIPRPLLSPQQIVILREDGRWGPDDPFTCPQLYQRVYCHHACILKPIHEPTDPLSILWWTPKASELKADRAVHNMYGIHHRHLQQFQTCLDGLATQFERNKSSLRAPSNEQWIDLLFHQLHLWFNRLSNFTSTLQNMIFIVAECQRRFLDLQAYIDYMNIVKGKLPSFRQSSKHSFPTPYLFLGAITYDLQVAEDFALTGVPVWLIRDLSAFSSSVRIQNLVAFNDVRSSVAMEPFPGVSRNIFVGPSGSLKKLHAIYQYSREHFSADKAEPNTAPSLPPPPPSSQIARHSTLPSKSKYRSYPSYVKRLTHEQNRTFHSLRRT